MKYYNKKIKMETYGEPTKKAKLKAGIKALGKGIKKAADYVVPPKTAEQMAFEKELKMKTQEEYRKAYLKAALSESKKKAEMEAKAKFDPEVRKQLQQKNQNVMDALMRL